MEDINPIKAPIYISIFDTALPIVMFFLLITLLIMLAGLLYRKRKIKLLQIQLLSSLDMNKEEKVKQAKNRLAKLSSLIEKNHFHELYMQITALIKQTLAEVFEVKVGEMTTEEIASVDFHRKDIKEVVLHFLKDVDHMKFANVHSEQKDAQLLYGQAEKTLNKLQEIAREIDEHNTEVAKKIKTRK